MGREQAGESAGLVLDNDPDGDTQNARSSILCIILLQAGKAFPLTGTSKKTELDEITRSKVSEIWLRLLRRTDALVEQHWLAIERVGKHLERHRRIDDPTELDGLIARAEHLVIRT